VTPKAKHSMGLSGENPLLCLHSALDSPSALRVALPRYLNRRGEAEIESFPIERTIVMLYSMRLLTRSTKPSLSQLPTEIKKHIVECVALLTEKRRYTVLPQFLKLAFVDHTFYELCSQLNWNVRTDFFYLMPLSTFPFSFLPVWLCTYASCGFWL
jgi:hypothetical protein